MESRVAQPVVGADGVRNYYAVRAVVAAVWVTAAFTVGKTDPVAASALLIAYPAWDAVANFVDALRNGGVARNPTQALNAAASGVTAVAIAAVTVSTSAVVAVFGGWAILAGLLQLATGVRRWKTVGAQWVMLLSGAQSALAGVFMIHRAFAAQPGITDIAPYAAFGGFYFLVSAVWLTVRRT